MTKIGAAEKTEDLLGCGKPSSQPDYLDMKIITTTKGQEILVDNEDYERLNKYKWQVKDSGYAFRNTTIGGRRGKRVYYLMHRIVLGLEEKSSNNVMVVDHKNRNKLDNRKSNLRLISKAENCWNTEKYSNNTSGYSNVFLCKEHKIKRWRSYITVNRKRIHLGYFEKPEEAYQAYVEAKAKYHVISDT